jgi:hypothetical protein
MPGFIDNSRCGTTALDWISLEYNSLHCHFIFISLVTFQFSIYVIKRLSFILVLHLLHVLLGLSVSQ